MSSKPGRKPVIYNLNLTDADTEYHQVLPSETVKFEIRCRGSYDLKLAYASGQSGSNYFTIPDGQSYWEDEVQTNTTLFLQCAQAGQVAEIKTWQT